MSIGAPSTLGTLLIQRLDAVLGTTLGQQANLASGARPNAVAQPGNPENPNSLQNDTQRHPREAVDKASARDQGRAAIGKAAQTEAGGVRAGRAPTHTGATPSAPTTLGFAARTILALLAEYPDSGQLARGQAPLVAGQTAAPGAQGNAPAGGPSAPAAGGTPAAALTQQAAGQAGQAASVFGAWASLAASLGEPGALPAQFAQSLAQTLQTSGLFYESHLANLAFGKTSLAALHQEPQGQIRPEGMPTPSGASPTADPGAPGGTSSSAPSTPANQAAAHAPTAQHSAVIPGLDPQTQLLVRQQLEVLAHQSFAWQGEAWPGAAMDWKIERREQDAGHDNMPEHWATRLNLQLPLLGEVQARLTLAGNQLVMRLVAPESADHLNEHIESLRGRLLAHGLQASQLSVLDRDDLPNEPDAHEPSALHS